MPPPKVCAKLGGVLFLFDVLKAASAEMFLRGGLAFAAGLIAVPPPKVCAKLGGVLFLFGLTAASAELFLRGRLVFAAGLIAVLCHVAATHAPDLTLGELDSGFAMGEEHLPRLVEVGPTLRIDRA